MKKTCCLYSHMKGGLYMRMRKEPPDGWFGEKIHKVDPSTGKIRGSNILTPKGDKCKMRLEPFSEGTIMRPPSSR